MPQARINGQNVEVTKAKLDHPTSEDWTFTISGEGAAQLHTTLTDLKAGPSELSGDRFTIPRSHLIYDDMPFLNTLARKLDAAAAGVGVDPGRNGAINR